MPPTPKLSSVHMFPTELAVLLAGKKAQRNEAGSNLVAKRLRKVGELAPNKQPIEFARALFVQVGDVVPSAFRGIPGIQVNGRGVATAAYTDGWCQSHWNQGSGWENTWGECWDNSTKMTGRTSLVVNSPLTGIKSFQLSEFKPKELESLARFNIGR